MTTEERMDKLEASLGKQDALVIELRDAVTVTAALEARHGRMMLEHTEWLVSLDKLMIDRREAEARLDQRISDLVSGIG